MLIRSEFGGPAYSKDIFENGLFRIKKSIFYWMKVTESIRILTTENQLIYWQSTFESLILLTVNFSSENFTTSDTTRVPT